MQFYLSADISGYLTISSSITGASSRFCSRLTSNSFILKSDRKRLLLFGWLLACVLLNGGGLSVEPVAARTSLSQTKDTVVYTTKTGQKYHRDGCRHLRQSKIKTTRKEAIKNGYGACKVCKP